MSKNEFLDVLKQSLEGEIGPDIIEENIKYYAQYIDSYSQEEQENVLKELGDPRLIGKTIIESERVAKQKGKYTGNQSYQDDYNEQEEPTEDKRSRAGNANSMIFTNLKWYHKIMLALIIFAIFIFIILLGRVLFAFGLPIILIILLLAMFKRR